MRPKPGADDQFMLLPGEFRQVDASVAGFRAEVVVRTARDPDEYLVAFVSEAAYHANAQDR